MHRIGLPGSRLDTPPATLAAAGRNSRSGRPDAGARSAAGAPAALRGEPAERRPRARQEVRAGPSAGCPGRHWPGRRSAARPMARAYKGAAKALPVSNLWFRGPPGPLRRRPIDVRVRAEQRGHPVGVSGFPGRVEFGQNALLVRAEPARRGGPLPCGAPSCGAPRRGAPRGLLPRGEPPRKDRAGQPGATMPPLRQRGDQQGHHHDGEYSQDHPQPPSAGPVRLRTAKPWHARNPR